MYQITIPGTTFKALVKDEAWALKLVKQLSKTRIGYRKRAKPEITQLLD